MHVRMYVCIHIIPNFFPIHDNWINSSMLQFKHHCSELGIVLLILYLRIIETPHVHIRTPTHAHMHTGHLLTYIRTYVLYVRTYVLTYIMPGVK